MNGFLDLLSGLISLTMISSILSFKNKPMLVKEIDKQDLLFVALSMQTKYKLWTGDKKLIHGLRIRGFHDVIETKELLKITKK